MHKNIDSKVLEMLTPEEIAAPITIAERRDCMKIGLCMAMSECNILPDEAEDMVKKAGIVLSRNPKMATELLSNPVGSAQQAADILKELGILSLGIGAGAGYLTGNAHFDLEKKVEGEDDPETNLLRKKLEGYSKLQKDLKDQKAFEATQSVPATSRTIRM